MAAETRKGKLLQAAAILPVGLATAILIPPAAALDWFTGGRSCGEALGDGFNDVMNRIGDVGDRST